MRRQTLLLLACGGLLAACAETPRQSAASYAPPPGDTGGQGAVLIARMTPEYDYFGESKAMLDGVQAYFARHAPGWKVLSPDSGEKAEATLKCKTYRDGVTNCAEVELSCSLSRTGARTHRFELERESEVCGKGGDAASFRAESYNHGLAIGQQTAAEIAKDPVLSGLIGEDGRRKLLEEALASGDPEVLAAFAETYPDSEEARTARRIAKSWREADPEWQAAQAARKAEEAAAAAAAAEAAAAAKSAADAEAAAQKAARDAARKAEAEAKAAKEEETGRYEMACFDRRSDVCGEYSFPSEEKRMEFARKCRQMGSELRESGECPRPSSSIGCGHTDRPTDTHVITWVYGQNNRRIADQCRATSGQVIEPF